MSVKLSELEDTNMLFTNEGLITKEDLVADLDYYRGKEIWTTTEYRAKINAGDMLDTAIERESSNMYESWAETVWENIDRSDLEKLQVIVDDILSGSHNLSYIEDEMVVIDI